MTGRYTEQSCSLTEFISQVSKETRAEDAPLAAAIEQNVPIYDCPTLRKSLSHISFRHNLMTELAAILQKGAGVFVLKQAYTNLDVIDLATNVFNEIIEDERGVSGGEDHFAEAGANDRIWNALEKLCLRAPSIFAEYYGNDMIALASEAWLGPGFQMTSQVNVVRPGGEAQQPHLDYHLGFQSAERASQYPAHVHQLSSALTLQGAIAQCDMPLASGPTKIIPHSQSYPAGYVAWRRDDFKQYFEQNFIQLPLEKGDAMFFNPALFHAAGANKTTDVARMANLLQVSSAFGRAMEYVDRQKMSSVLYPSLLESLGSGQMTMGEIANAVACCAEGYQFPTDLDRSPPPAGGLAPTSRQEIMLDKLKNYKLPDDTR